jgi:hypothetical protein
LVTISTNGADIAASMMRMAGPWAAPEWPAPLPAAAESAARAVDGAPAEASNASDTAREEGIVRAVLAEYARAYERLDIQAAKAVWPSLSSSEIRDLRRAFRTLDSQQLRFTSCDFSISGDAASARCGGDASYQPKVGAGRRHQPARWNFDLSRNDDGWHIVNVNAIVATVQ